MLAPSPMHFTSIFEHMFGASHWVITDVALVFQELINGEDRDAM